MSERLLRHGASSRLNHPNLTDISQATDHPHRPPFSLSDSFSSLFSVVSPLTTATTAAAATRALSPYASYLDQPTNQPTNPPAVAAVAPPCPSSAFPAVVPVSLFLTPLSSWLGPRERRLRAGVASPKTPQTPAGTRLHPVALSVLSSLPRSGTPDGWSGGQATTGNWDSEDQADAIYNVDTGNAPRTS